MLVSGLRVLFCAGSVLLAFGVITLAVMFGGGSMGLGGVFVVLGGFVVLVSRHFLSPFAWLVFQPPNRINLSGRTFVKLGNRRLGGSHHSSQTQHFKVCNANRRMAYGRLRYFQASGQSSKATAAPSPSRSPALTWSTAS
jgi:hypothetical protein